MNGQTIEKRELQLNGIDQTVSFDISNEAAGVYLIYISGNDGSLSTQKMMLQK